MYYKKGQHVLCSTHTVYSKHLMLQNNQLSDVRASSEFDFVNSAAT